MSRIPIVLVVFLLLSGCATSQEGAPPATSDAAEAQTSSETQRYPLVPQPRHLEARSGTFVFDEQTRIVLSDASNEKLRTTAELFATLFRTGSVLPMQVADESAPEPSENAVFLRLADSDMNDEGYTLDVTSDRVVVTASTPRGIFYGVQTLRQLLPSAIAEGLGHNDGGVEWAIPTVRIEDAPRFEYRGMHLDVGRHFMPVSFVKKYIDLLAMYKMNTFHWHLTEDQGWRIEIEKYPKLTEVGACRDSSMVGHYTERTYDGSEYCGYYTQEEVREVVDYAQKRFVTVIPEIEMPGHSRAALAAYPELGCTDGPYTVATTWGIHEEIYCPKEETFTFLKDVLTEVMALFPSEYIHIGGDEAPKEQWEESDVAQKVIEREGLADEHELQSYFIRRIETFLNDHDRQLIGWDEILEGGLAPEATVMSWRGIEGGIKAARQGHDAIMTPTDYLYFDYYQGDPDAEPVAIGGDLPLRMVYSYEPVPDALTQAQAQHILGAQGNVWTEYIKTPDKVEYMAYPRALALSEMVWSTPEARDWSSFTERLPARLAWLDALDVDYRTPDFVSTESVSAR